ncbi:MAG: hypothetical protein KGL43_08100, partial [Burkholderiales bacterium]|nr:hypothetical protein [Burkholderiales bacterium]
MIAKADFDCAGDALPRPHPNCYWLGAGCVLAGEHPGAAGAEALARRLAAIEAAGVTLFVDLTAPGDPVLAYTPVAARRLSFAIPDFGLPGADGLRRTLAALLAEIGRGGLVYLHCKAGVGRTGTVAGCLLVEQGFAGDEALALLQRKWAVAGQRAASARTP